LTALIDELRPDLVHAMRLPYEGFMAAAAVHSRPLLLSIWGNDFTLFANLVANLANSPIWRCSVPTDYTAIAAVISISPSPEDFPERSPGASFPAAVESAKMLAGSSLITTSCANSKFREERGW
jgi:hypothetical protein